MTVAGGCGQVASVEYALKAQTLARQLKTASSAGVKTWCFFAAMIMQMER